MNCGNQAAGSCTLIVLIVMSILLIGCMYGQKTSALLTALAYKRQLYIQHMYALQGLLVAGVAYAQEQGNVLTEQKRAQQYQQWPCADSTHTHTGCISWHVNNEHIHIDAQLVCESGVRYGVRYAGSAVLHRSDDDATYTIVDWCVGV